MNVYLTDNIKNSHEQCIISIWGIDTIDSKSIVSICGVYCKHNFPHKYIVRLLHINYQDFVKIMLLDLKVELHDYLTLYFQNDLYL